MKAQSCFSDHSVRSGSIIPRERRRQRSRSHGAAARRRISEIEVARLLRREPLILQPAWACQFQQKTVRCRQSLRAGWEVESVFSNSQAPRHSRLVSVPAVARLWVNSFGFGVLPCRRGRPAPSRPRDVSGDRLCRCRLSLLRCLETLECSGESDSGSQLLARCQMAPFLTGMAINLGNPKVIVFFLALRPTVVNLASLTPLGLAELTALVAIIAWTVLTIYARQRRARGACSRKRGRHQTSCKSSSRTVPSWLLKLRL
jgi:hypothetical protein